MLNYSENYDHLFPEIHDSNRLEYRLVKLADPPNWPTDDFDWDDTVGMEFLEHVASRFAEAARHCAEPDDLLTDENLGRIVDAALDDLDTADPPGYPQARAALALGARSIPLDGLDLNGGATLADATNFALSCIGRRLCVGLRQGLP